MGRYNLIFLSSFAIFIFFLAPNLNTGDGGELATAGYFLGTAHPSSYPLYLMIAKTFAFLPLGNIAFRTAIISALFSSLTLTLIYWFLLKLTTSSTASLFSATVLLVSYSYFTQSVVAKFYTLNLFLIMLLFSLWAIHLVVERRASGVKRIDRDKQNDTRLLYFTMFIAGLITANHHTGVIIFCPVAAAWFLTKKHSLKLSSALTGIALLISGFIINSYLVIRGSSDHFFNAVNINDFTDFYKVISRQAYGSGGTATAATYFLSGFAAYWYGLRNFFLLLTVNFSIFSYLFFLAGSVYLGRKNLKLFIFIMLSLLLYGPLLAKLTLWAEHESEVDYYVGAHQYFIPAFTFYCIVLGAGFYQCEKMLKATELKLLPKVLPAIFALFPLIFLVSRTTDCNYRTNFVPYQLTKDTYSVLPSDSVIMTFGDNASYGGWYLKLVGRYREDICQIASSDDKKIDWMFQGCNKKVYGTVFPMFYSQNFNKMVPVILKYRYYGNGPVKETGAYKQYLYSQTLSVDYLYLPQGKFIKDKNYRRDEVNSFLSQTQLAADKVINPSVCLSHFTDDLFSRELCSSYAIHLINMARLYSDESYHRTGKQFMMQVNSQPRYPLDETEKNRPYLELSTHILRFNKWPILYMRVKE